MNWQLQRLRESLARPGACTLCGHHAPGDDAEHAHDFDHKRHVVLSHRAWRGWINATGPIANAAHRARFETVYEGARHGRSEHAALLFLRVGDARQILSAADDGTQTAKLLRIAIAASAGCAAQKCSWRRAVLDTCDVTGSDVELPMWWL